MNGPPPELLAEYDQALTGVKEDLARAVKQYREFNALDGDDMSTFCSLANALERRHSAEDLATFAAVAIRQLALGDVELLGVDDG